MTAALYKLHAWLSPSYPIGAYTYSHGLEYAVASGLVEGPASAERWIADCLSHGAGRTDAILLAHAWRAEHAGDPQVLDEIAELALALAPSAERLLETEAQGAAFTQVTAEAWGGGGPLPYPVALGRAAARHQIGLADTCTLFLQAFASNLVSAAIRLVPLGQTDGQRILARLMPLCLDLAAEAERAKLDDIGGCAIRADIASMQHETQTTRLFRT